MTAILSMIWCWLQAFWFTLNDFVLGLFDSLLSASDEALGAIQPIAASIPTIPDQYAWVLGATGMSQALAILGSALAVRFALQAVPFVRWGS